MIRLCDYAGDKGFFDLPDPTIKADKMFFASLSFTEVAYDLTKHIIVDEAFLGAMEAFLPNIIQYVYDWADSMGIDLDWFVEQRSDTTLSENHCITRSINFKHRENEKEIKMDPEDLQTRLNQEIITTSDPRKMLGMYTAKRVLRTWTEDFIDQDTGELVTIERNDVIMERGVLLTPEQVSELSFYLQSGDIKEVEITNQCRNGIEYLGGGFTPWMATVKVNGKNTKMLLFAQDINQALEILKDYTELETSGSFFILGIKQRSSLIYIDSQLSSYAMNEKGEAVVDEKDDEKVVKQRFYIVDASIQNLDATQDQVEDGVDVYCQTFLLKSANADSAKKQIELYMARKAKERAETGKEAIICKYGITINAASPVGIGSVVPEDFSEAYKHAESDFAKEVEKKDSKEEDEDENSEE